MEKLCLVFLLIISLFGCSSKKYTVETLEYLSILPSVDEIYRYHVLGMDDDEIFVAYTEDICTLVPETVFFEDGTSEVMDTNICNVIAKTIYAIDKDTKEYRIVESNIGNNYISSFYPISESEFFYHTAWYDIENDVYISNFYLDNLDLSNPIVYDGKPLYGSNRTLLGPGRVGEKVYFTCVENDELVLYVISSANDIVKTVIVESVDYETYSEMQSWNQYIGYYMEDKMYIYNIEDATYTMILNKEMKNVVNIVDNKVYGFNHDGEFNYYDLLTNEMVALDKSPVAYYDDLILFDDEIWYVENNQYKKESIEYKIKGNVSERLYIANEIVLGTNWFNEERAFIVIKKK